MTNNHKLTPLEELVTPIIVTHNSQEVVANCLEQLKDFKYIQVVDNASTDNTCKIVSSTCPHATLHQLDKNLGFGCANNVALERVKTPYALLINPDATIDKENLQKLIDASHTYPNSVLIAPRQQYPNGKVMEIKDHMFKRTKRRAYHAPEGDVCVKFISGAIALANMELLRKVGFFDPNIFLYYEDDDLSMRCSKQHLALIMVMDAIAYHNIGKSTPPSNRIMWMKNVHIAWSRLYMHKKYGKPYALLSVILFIHNLFMVFVSIFGLNRKRTIKHVAKFWGSLKFILQLPMAKSVKA